MLKYTAQELKEMQKLRCENRISSDYKTIKELVETTIDNYVKSGIIAKDNSFKFDVCIFSKESISLIIRELRDAGFRVLEGDDSFSIVLT